MNEIKLTCPRCGSTYLHHREVSVIERFNEDGASVETTVPANPNKRPTRILLEASETPGRRGSVSIRFDCEECGAGCSHLNFLQHEGETFMEWTHAPKKRGEK